MQKSCRFFSVRRIGLVRWSKIRPLSNSKDRTSSTTLRRRVTPIVSLLSTRLSSASSRLWKVVPRISTWSDVSPPQMARLSMRIGSPWIISESSMPTTKPSIRPGVHSGTSSSVRSASATWVSSWRRPLLAPSSRSCSRRASPSRSSLVTMLASLCSRRTVNRSSSTRRSLATSMTSRRLPSLFTVKGTLDSGVLYYCNRSLPIGNSSKWVDGLGYWVISMGDDGLFYIVKFIRA